MMELHQVPSAGGSKQFCKRGPYRSVAKGMLPKRRTEEAVQKLAEKSAKRGHELEVAKKAMKRLEQEIKTLEGLLDFANKRVVCLVDEVEGLGDECDQLQNREQDLQTQVDLLQSELSIYQRCFSGSVAAPLPTIKKKPL